MADIVNLNHVRKARQQEEQAKRAASNRVRHGRATAEKTVEKAKAEHEARELDGKKLE